MNNLLLFLVFVMILLPILYIVYYVVTFIYRCFIADRSIDSFKPTIKSWLSSFRSYESHGRLIILKHSNLPFGISFNASLIVKHANGNFSNTIVHHTDKVYMLFNNLLFTRKFACQLDYHTYDIQDCQWLRLHLHLHDGRMFNVNGSLYISFTNIDENLVQKQSIYDVGKNVVYLPKFNYNHGKFLKEKNWQFFTQNQRVYMIYTINPFAVYEINKTNFEVIRQVKNESLDTKEKLRCSVPPVFVNDRYYMVIHSKQYMIYVMTFDTHFNVIAVSSNPLCDNDDGLCKYSIYFPCGMIFDTNTNTFLISMGINDMTIGLMKFSKKEIDDILSK